MQRPQQRDERENEDEQDAPQILLEKVLDRVIRQVSLREKAADVRVPILPPLSPALSSRFVGARLCVAQLAVRVPSQHCAQWKGNADRSPGPSVLSMVWEIKIGSAKKHLRAFANTDGGRNLDSEVASA